MPARKGNASNGRNAASQEFFKKGCTFMSHTLQGRSNCFIHRILAIDASKKSALIDWTAMVK